MTGMADDRVGEARDASSGGRTILALGLLLAHFAATWILGPGRGLDVPFTGWHYLGVLLVLVVWSASLMGWGSALLRIAGRAHARRLLPSLGIGLGAAALAVALLGALGAIGYEMRPLFLILTDVGALIFAFSAHPPDFSDWRAMDRSERRKWLALAAVFGLVVLARIVRALYPDGHSDPMFYQLFAPRYWVEQGRIFPPPQYPYSFLASYWEYLHVWGLHLFSAEPGLGLIETHLFAQLEHTVFGYLGTGIAIYVLFRRSFDAPPVQAMASALFAILARDLFWFTTSAKNDWGTIFWMILALIELPPYRARRESEGEERRSWILAGLFMGLAAGAKFTHLVAVGCFVLGAAFLAWRDRGRHPGWLKGLGWAAGAGAFTLAPYVLRNLVMTGNPLYPYYSSLFGTEASLNPAIANMLRFYQGDGLHLKFTDWLNRLAIRDPAVVVSVVFGGIGLVRARHRGPGFAVLLTTIVAVIVFVSFGTTTEVRHLGALLVLLYAFIPGGIGCILDLCRLPRRPWRTGVAVVFGIVVALCLDWANRANTDGYLYRGMILAHMVDFHRDLDPVRYIRAHHFGGPAAAWVRMNLPPGTKLMLTGSNYLYYLPLYEAVTFEDAAEFKVLITGAGGKSAQETLREVYHGHGYRYLMDVIRRSTSVLSDHLNPLLVKRPCAVLYESVFWRVVDLDRLERDCPPGTPAARPPTQVPDNVKKSKR